MDMNEGQMHTHRHLDLHCCYSSLTFYLRFAAPAWSEKNLPALGLINIGIRDAASRNVGMSITSVSIIIMGYTFLHTVYGHIFSSIICVPQLLIMIKCKHVADTFALDL